MIFKWKMERQCDNCPFADVGSGVHLRESLGVPRFRSILNSLLNGAPFMCHKTSKETGDGTDLYCAGALDYQQQQKIETDYMKLCRNLEGCQESKATMFKRLKAISKRRMRS